VVSLLTIKLEATVVAPFIFKLLLILVLPKTFNNDKIVVVLLIIVGPFNEVVPDTFKEDNIVV
jgi:hypothetical protein